MPRESHSEKSQEIKSKSKPEQFKADLEKPKNPIIEKAKKKFAFLLKGKFSMAKREETRKFSMTADILMVNLDLSRNVPSITDEELDEIALSVPGISKTKTGYEATDISRIAEYLGISLHEIFEPGENKVLKIFQSEPQKEFSALDLAKMLDLEYNTISTYLNKLCKKGDIIISGKVKLTPGRGYQKLIFKLANKEKSK